MKNLKKAFTVKDAIAKLVAIRDSDNSAELLVFTESRSDDDFARTEFHVVQVGISDKQKAVSRGGVPAVVVCSGYRDMPPLTLTAAIEALAQIQEKLKTDEVPILMEGSGKQPMSYCDVFEARAGASNIYKKVSRKGQPVVVFGKA